MPWGMGVCLCYASHEAPVFLLPSSNGWMCLPRPSNSLWSSRGVGFHDPLPGPSSLGVQTFTGFQGFPPTGAVISQQQFDAF